VVKSRRKKGKDEFDEKGLKSQENFDIRPSKERDENRSALAEIRLGGGIGRGTARSGDMPLRLSTNSPMFRRGTGFADQTDKKGKVRQ